MAQSLSNIYIHIIFSTCNREKFLEPSFNPSLWNYLAVTCQSLKCTPIKIGGAEDHVHILCELSRDVTVMDLIKKLKTHSSRWLKSVCPNMPYFQWQSGYGVFSINSSERTFVIDYIDKQEEHHKACSFKDEFMAFLKKYNVRYDEKYLWN